MNDFIKRFNIFSKRAIVYTFLIISLSLIAGYLYYIFSPKSYKSYVSIKLLSKNIETQKDILKSRRILQKTIKKLGFDIDYYTKGLFYKKIDLYDKKPFLIKNLKIKNPLAYEREFEIRFLKNGKFTIGENDLILPSSKKNIISSSNHIETSLFSFDLKPLRVDLKKRYFIVFHKMSKLLQNIEKRIQIEQASKNSSLLKIYYEDSNPKKVKDFLSTLIEVYKENLKEIQKRKDYKIYSFLESQLKEAKIQTESSLKKLRDYEKQNSISSKDISSFSIGYEEELRKINLELKTIQMVEREIKNQNYMILSALEGKYPQLSSLAKEIEEKLKQKEILKEKNGELDPKVILFSQKIEKLQNILNSMLKDIKNSLYKRKYTIKKLLNQKNSEISKLPKKEQQLITLKQNYDVNKRYYDYLLREKSELLLKKMKENGEIIIIDPPVIPDFPYAPDLKKILEKFLLAGLFLAFLAAFFKNKEENLIKSPKDIEEISSLPVYGVIPFVTDHRLYNKIYVNKEDIPSLYKEAYREIKTDIELLDSGWKSKVIGVSSTIPGEGKTVFVSNLASLLSSGEQKTILLCADFFLSEIHTKFDLSNEKGLSELLEKRADIKEVLQIPEGFKNLTVITSGKPTENPHKLIESKEIKLLIKNLRRYFDFIIIDTTPIDVTNDSFILLKECDISIFVTKSNFTKKSFIKRIEHLSKNFSLKNPGFVITSVRKEHLNRISYDEEYIFRKSK